MRRLRPSITFEVSLENLLLFGEEKFGPKVADKKRERFLRVIATNIREFPGIGRFDEALGVYVFHVSRTPFVLLYDFDDEELRLILTVHQRADRSQLDFTNVVW